MTVPAKSRSGRARRAVAQMVEALEAEIDAIRGQGASPSPVIGSRRAILPHGAIYTMDAPPEVSCRAGGLVQVETEGETLTARVLSAGDGRLSLLVPRDLGPETPPLRIHADTSWLAAAARDALRALRRVPRLAALLLDPSDVDPSVARKTESLARAVEGLNPEQTAAVRRAVGGPMHVVWGPPGTGKTRTLARVVEALHGEGRVLVVAPTNQAVDHLLLAVAERLDGRPVLRDHRVLRVGPIASRELRRRYGDRVALDRAVRATAGEGALDDHVEALEEVIAGLVDPQDEVEDELRRRLAEDLDRIRAGAHGRDVEREAIRHRLLRRARIVATTLHRASLPGQLPGDYDAVVVDEASAASIPHVFLAACRARTRVVIAGDPRQLPPVVKSDDPRARKWLGRDVFHLGGLVGPAREGDPPPVLSRLVRQYRMAPEICDLVGAFAYDRRLRTAAARRDGPEGEPFLLDGRAVALIDTGPLVAHLERAGRRPDGSRTRRRANPWHRAVISRLLSRWNAGDRDGESDRDVALLTPYRDQVSHLREWVGRVPGVAIRTVHRAQGQEWDAVILDLPEAGRVSPSPFTRARYLHEVGARLLNVGMSRARRQLVIVADCDYHRQDELAGSATNRLLEHLVENGQRIDGRAVLGGG